MKEANGVQLDQKTLQLEALLLQIAKEAQRYAVHGQIW
jgi:hypothetical protein